jgi:hypothetical protein
MKSLFAASLVLAVSPLAAQTAPAPAAAALATAKFTLDTPIETIAADEKGKAVLSADLPDLLGHPAYDTFKGMSLNQLAPYSEGKLTPEVLAKVGTDLAAVK